MEDARDLIGKTVLVKLISNEGLRFVDVPEEGPFFCKVEAVDEVGMWVENRRFITIEIRDSKGKFIPKEKQKPEKHMVYVLLPWRNVQTVVMFSADDAITIEKKLLVEGGRDIRRVGFVE